MLRLKSFQHLPALDPGPKLGVKPSCEQLAMSAVFKRKLDTETTTLVNYLLHPSQPCLRRFKGLRSGWSPQRQIIQRHMTFICQAKHKTEHPIDLILLLVLGI